MQSQVWAWPVFPGPSNGKPPGALTLNRLRRSKAPQLGDSPGSNLVPGTVQRIQEETRNLRSTMRSSFAERELSHQSGELANDLPVSSALRIIPMDFRISLNVLRFFLTRILNTLRLRLMIGSRRLLYLVFWRSRCRRRASESNTPRNDVVVRAACWFVKSVAVG
jgi:hypothetical protein